MKRYKVYAYGEEIAVQTARVSAQRFNRVWEGKQRPKDQTETAYYVQIEWEKPTKLRVEVEGEEVKSVEVRPLRKKYRYAVRGNEIEVEINAAGHFTVEINGYEEVLTVFVDPIERYVAREGDIYFGEGEHEAGLIMPKDGQRVYIDKGAVVYGAIYAIGKTGVSVEGRGVLDASKYLRPWLLRLGGAVPEEWPENYLEIPDIKNQIEEGYKDDIVRALKESGASYGYSYPMGVITAHGCKNLKISGVILKDSFLWTLILRNGCENAVIDNVKIIGQWRYNADGINVCDSKNVTVKNCFVRSFDDCIVVRGGYLITGYECGCKNIRIENNVCWCDWGKVFEIWSGDCPSDIDNVYYKDNCAIRVSYRVHSIETWFGSERTSVQNVTYEGTSAEYDEVHLSEQYQYSDGQTYDETQTGPDEVLILISVGKLGKNYGNQECGEDDGEYKIYYKNIRYEGVTENKPYGKIFLNNVEKTTEFSDVYFDGVSITEYRK